MKPLWLSACLVLGGGGIAIAQEADDSIDTISNEFGALQRKNSLLQVALKEDDVLPFIDRCWKIYDQSEGDPEEFRALSEVLSLSSTVISAKLERQWQDAAAKLFTDFIDDDRMVAFVGYLPAPVKLKKEAESYVADLKAKTRSVAVKAAIAFNGLQDQLSRNSQGSLDEAQEKALVARLEEFARQFGDQKMPYGDQTYAEHVKATLYAMEHLKIGAVAPEIAANDLDGVGFKLSDYRGKAVMLDFWGYW